MSGRQSGGARALSGAAASAALLVLAAMASSAQAADTPQSSPRTIGLVIGDWTFALYETQDGKAECPDGMLFKQEANFDAEYPTPEAKKKFGETYGYYTNRGVHGENVFYHPTSGKDPLPFRAAQGSTGLGLNLDGDETGKGGGAILPHQNLTSPDGAKGIDNQLYRVLGCTGGWRKAGVARGTLSQYLRQDSQARILLEISGVDSEVNDDDVTITTWRGRDPVATDTQDKLIPWLSQRIDYGGGLRYHFRFKGKIVDGVLITEPFDIRLPSYERQGMFDERLIQKMRMRLKLTPTGAEGMLGGYQDVEYWFASYAKNWGGHKLADTQGWSGPATYQALQTYADYRDPATGKLAISSAYEVGFARAFIIHDREAEATVTPRVIASSPPAAVPTLPLQRTASR